jgi:hypothetical protein
MDECRLCSRIVQAHRAFCPSRRPKRLRLRAYVGDGLAEVREAPALKRSCGSKCKAKVARRIYV